jgi:branched-chain amino acid transport system substrate-binding protein
MNWHLRLIPRASALLLLTVACGFGTGSSATSSPGAPLKIGVIQPLTGANAGPGQEMVNAVKLAAKQQNAKGGVLNRQIDVIAESATTPAEGASAAQDLINQGATILTGSYISGVANAAIPVAAKAGVLWWETNATAPTLTTGGNDNVVRIGPNAANMATPAVDFVAGPGIQAIGKSMSNLSVFIAHEQSIFGTATGDAANKLFQSQGSKVQEVAYDPAAPDLSSVVLRAKQANADVWYVVGYIPDETLLLKTARQLGFRPKIIEMNTADAPNFKDSLGAAGMEGIIAITFPRYDTNPAFAPGVKTYQVSYVQEFGQGPQFTNTLTTYAGIQVLFEVVTNAKSIQPAPVRQTVAGMDVPRGGVLANGNGIKMDSNFDNTRALPIICQWQAGNCVTAFPAAAAPSGAKIQGLPLPPWS